jgi:hypothetical protein
MRFRFRPEGSRPLDAGLLNLIERVERICSRFSQKRIRRKLKEAVSIQDSHGRPKSFDGRNTEKRVVGHRAGIWSTFTAPSMKNSPHCGPANTKSKLLLLVPCLLIVVVVVLWLYILLGS